MLNIDINPYLDKEIVELVNNLEKLTNVPAEKFIANLVSGKDELIDLELLNEALEREKEYPIEQRIKDHHYYTSEELDQKLGL